MGETLFNRADLQRLQGMTPRLIQAFESMQRKAVYAASTSTSNADATVELQDATAITLSPNAALTNERILAVDAEGLYLTDLGAGNEVIIGMIYPISTNGFALSFNMQGDSSVNLPGSGVIPSSAIGPYANDAAAAAAGVQVGEIYKGPTGSVLWRQV